MDGDIFVPASNIVAAGLWTLELIDCFTLTLKLYAFLGTQKIARPGVRCP